MSTKIKTPAGWKDVTANGVIELSSFFTQFHGLSYTRNGLSIYDNRVTILEGGYAIKDGYCLIKILLRSNFNFAEKGNDAIYDFPAPKTHSYCAILSADSNDLIPATYTRLADYYRPGRLEFFSLKAGQICWVYLKYKIK